MSSESNQNAPLEKTTEHNGHRLRRLFKWKRRDGKERHMVDWVFDGNIRNLFKLIATVGGISVVVAVIAYPDILDTTFLSDAA